MMTAARRDRDASLSATPGDEGSERYASYDKASSARDHSDFCRFGGICSVVLIRWYWFGSKRLFPLRQITRLADCMNGRSQVVFKQSRPDKRVLLLSKKRMSDR
jgi:hypothetical protein